MANKVSIVALLISNDSVYSNFSFQYVQGVKTRMFLFLFCFVILNCKHFYLIEFNITNAFI